VILRIRGDIQLTNIAIILAFVIFSAGCATNSHRAASAIPGCGVDDINIKNQTVGWTDATFEAVCNGRTYTCLTRSYGGTQCSLDSYNSSSDANNENAPALKESEEVQPELQVQVSQSENIEVEVISAQQISESTETSSSSAETNESVDQPTRDEKPLAFTPSQSSKNKEWLYTATTDAEIDQFFGTPYSVIERHLVHRRIDDCSMRRSEFSACDMQVVIESDDSFSIVEVREAEGLRVVRSHGFSEMRYLGTRVQVSGASKFLLSAIDQQARRIKTNRLDLQVLLEMPSAEEAVFWFGYDLRELEQSLSGG
jgi:hypothetical protein